VHFRPWLFSFRCWNGRHHAFELAFFRWAHDGDCLRRVYPRVFYFYFAVLMHNTSSHTYSGTRQVSPRFQL
jgi:hypothetical protein